MDCGPRRGKLVIVGDTCRSRPDVKKALEILCPALCDVYYSPTGLDDAGGVHGSSSVASTCLYVCDDFSSMSCKMLRSKGLFIIGPPLLTMAAQAKQVPTRPGRPQYCSIMAGVTVCFTGYRSKEELALHTNLMHYMGGATRKEFTCNVTHVVAKSVKGEKYRAAVGLGRPIMNCDWIPMLWQQRDDVTVKASDPQKMMAFRIPPLYGCTIALLGFSSSEQTHMQELIIANGGATCAVSADECTHVVVDENTVRVLPALLPENAYLVKSEWFWASIQIEARADEELYLFKLNDHENDAVRPHATPRPMLRTKKRKRVLRENLAQLASEGQALRVASSSQSPPRRRSSIDRSCATTESSAFVDTSASAMTCDFSVSSVHLSTAPEDMSTTKAGAAKMSSRRRAVISELHQTETNYCTILSNILSVFRDGAENPNQPKGPLLSATDLKIIFGKIPPILELHMAIRDDLTDVLQNWRDDISVARIILERAEEMSKAYPPFINYFEETKETIVECERSNPRFHAFLKLCERKPECGRQTLAELLINIVQRIPRIELLLGEILKYTDNGSAEHGQLLVAQRVLKDVMKHINEAKRNAEGQVVLFNIVNDIDKCPPNLLSASRAFVTKVDVVEKSGKLCGNGRHLSLFVFSDVLEIVKRRTGHPSFSAGRSPAPGSVAVVAGGSSATASSTTLKGHTGSSAGKPYKHLLLLNLSAIKRVVDVDESSGCSDIFCLVCRAAGDASETLYSFALPSNANITGTPGDSNRKSEFLKLLCKYIASCNCRTDFENILTTCAPAYLDISDRSTLGDLTASGRSSTFRRAADFGKRVGSALTMKMSMNQRVKRAVSSLLTPGGRPVTHGSTSSLASFQSLDAGFRPATANDSEDLSPVSSVPGSPVIEESPTALPTPALGRRRLVETPAAEHASLPALSGALSKKTFSRC